MRVYIAAPFELRSSAQMLMRDLEQAGHDVTAQWLRTDDRLCDADAQKDLDDIDRADVLVAYNPAEFGQKGTGGRHVELGYAVARNKAIVLVGQRSNIFHHLNRVRVVTTMTELLACLQDAA